MHWIVFTPVPEDISHYEHVEPFYITNIIGDLVEIYANRTNTKKGTSNRTWYEQGTYDFANRVYRVYQDCAAWDCLPAELEQLIIYGSSSVVEETLIYLSDWYAGWYDAAALHEFALTGEY